MTKNKIEEEIREILAGLENMEENEWNTTNTTDEAVYSLTVLFKSKQLELIERVRGKIERLECPNHHNGDECCLDEYDGSLRKELNQKLDDIKKEILGGGEYIYGETKTNIRRSPGVNQKAKGRKPKELVVGKK